MPGYTADTREDVVRNIIALLIPEKYPFNIPLKDLLMRYRQEEGELIPHKELGYSSLVDFLRTVPELEVVSHNGAACINFLGSSRSKHVSELVARQKTTPHNRSRSGTRRRIPPGYITTKIDPSVFAFDPLKFILTYLEDHPSGVTKSRLINKIRSKRPGVYFDMAAFDKHLDELGNRVEVRDNLLFLATPQDCPWNDQEFIEESKKMVKPVKLDFEAMNGNDYCDEGEFDYVGAGEPSPLQSCIIEDLPIISRNSTYPEENNNYEQHCGDGKHNQQAIPSNTVNGQMESNDYGNARAQLKTPEYEKNGENGAQNDETPHEEPLINDRVRFRLEKLIQDYPEGVWCADLAKLYFQQYKLTLDWADYDFNSLSDMVQSLPSIFHSVQPHPHSDFMVYPASRRNEALKTPKVPVPTLASVYKIYADPDDDVLAIPRQLPPETINQLIPRDVLPLGETIGQVSLTEFGTQKTKGMDEVIVCEAFTPYFFWIHLRKKTRKMNKMVEELQAFYNENYRRYEVPLIFLEKGLNVVARFYGIWTRGIVKAIEPDVESTTAVLFYDYGTVHKYPAKELCFLQRKFTVLPAQAIPCALAHVRPSKANAVVDPKGQERWSIEASRVFVQKVHEVPMIGTVEEYCYENNSLLLNLIDTSSDDDVDIAAWLVESGWAQTGERVSIKIPRNFFNDFYRNCNIDLSSAGGETYVHQVKVKKQRFLELHQQLPANKKKAISKLELLHSRIFRGNSQNNVAQYQTSCPTCGCCGTCRLIEGNIQSSQILNQPPQTIVIWKKSVEHWVNTGLLVRPEIVSVEEEFEGSGLPFSDDLLQPEEQKIKTEKEEEESKNNQKYYIYLDEPNRFVFEDRRRPTTASIQACSEFAANVTPIKATLVEDIDWAAIAAETSKSPESEKKDEREKGNLEEKLNSKGKLQNPEKSKGQEKKFVAPIYFQDASKKKKKNRNAENLRKFGRTQSAEDFRKSSEQIARNSNFGTITPQNWQKISDLENNLRRSRSSEQFSRQKIGSQEEIQKSGIDRNLSSQKISEEATEMVDRSKSSKGEKLCSKNDNNAHKLHGSKAKNSLPEKALKKDKDSQNTPEGKGVSSSKIPKHLRQYQIRKNPIFFRDPEYFRTFNFSGLNKCRSLSVLRNLKPAESSSPNAVKDLENSQDLASTKPSSPKSPKKLENLQNSASMKSSPGKNLQKAVPIESHPFPLESEDYRIYFARIARIDLKFIDPLGNNALKDDTVEARNAKIRQLIRLYRLNHVPYSHTECSTSPGDWILSEDKSSNESNETFRNIDGQIESASDEGFFSANPNFPPDKDSSSVFIETSERISDESKGREELQDGAQKHEEESEDGKVGEFHSEGESKALDAVEDHRKSSESVEKVEGEIEFSARESDSSENECQHQLFRSRNLKMLEDRDEKNEKLSPKKSAISGDDTDRYSQRSSVNIRGDSSNENGSVHCQPPSNTSLTQASSLTSQAPSEDLNEVDIVEIFNGTLHSSHYFGRMLKTFKFQAELDSDDDNFDDQLENNGDRYRNEQISESRGDQNETDHQDIMGNRNLQKHQEISKNLENFSEYSESFYEIDEEGSFSDNSNIFFDVTEENESVDNDRTEEIHDEDCFEHSSENFYKNSEGENTEITVNSEIYDDSCRNPQEDHSLNDFSQVSENFQQLENLHFDDNSLKISDLGGDENFDDSIDGNGKDFSKVREIGEKKYDSSEKSNKFDDSVEAGNENSNFLENVDHSGRGNDFSDINDGDHSANHESQSLIEKTDINHELDRSSEEEAVDRAKDSEISNPQHVRVIIPDDLPYEVPVYIPNDSESDGEFDIQILSEDEDFELPPLKNLPALRSIDYSLPEEKTDYSYGIKIIKKQSHVEASENHQNKKRNNDENKDKNENNANKNEKGGSGDIHKGISVANDVKNRKKDDEKCSTMMRSDSWEDDLDMELNYDNDEIEEVYRSPEPSDDDDDDNLSYDYSHNSIDTISGFD